MAISGPFAEILDADRAQFNQRVTEVRRRFPAFDTGAFAQFLQTEVDHLIRAVAQVMPERARAAAIVAYDLALELVSLALAGPGARSVLVNQSWQTLAPQYVLLLARHPAEVLGMLSNAVINIGKVPDARPLQWIAEMGQLASLVNTVPEMQAAGQILAWRAGLAHLRIGAIQAADELPEALAHAAFRIADGTPWSAARECLLTNPWSPATAADADMLQAGREIGRFSGFGGEFAQPPLVQACTEGFFVNSAAYYGLLVADLHGAVLHGASKEEFDNAKIFRFPETGTLSGSRLAIGQRSIELDLPAGHIALSCNAHTIAVTSPFSHAIRLLPTQ
jgi:hypothetical protein